MKRTLTFEILGTPIPCYRPRFSGDHCWDSQKQQKLIISLSLEKQRGKETLLVGPLEAQFHFYFPIPRMLSKVKRQAQIGQPVTRTPDVDNLIKMYLDCAQNGILFNNDSFVTTIQADKSYSLTPKTTIIIREID